MKIHTGDTVVVISGKDKGKTGTVVRVLEEKNRVVVEGVNMRVKHIRKTPQQAGQRIKFEAAIAASNVMLVDPKTKKRTRVGYSIDAKGKKTRIAKKSGEVLKAASSVKASSTKKAQKGTEKKAEATPKEKDAPATPASSGQKSPFWKRMGFSSQAAADGAAAGVDAKDLKAAPTQHRSQGG